MADRAQVTSVEAIDTFRAGLILYQVRARAAVEEVSSEILRTKLWLQNDQQQLWERELRTRSRKLEEARNELFAARLSKLQEASPLQYLAVHRAEHAVREAEARLAVIKKWNRELENRSEQLLKQVDSLHSRLVTEMPRAVAHLTQVVKALEAYAGVTPLGSAPVTNTGEVS